MDGMLLQAMRRWWSSVLTSRLLGGFSQHSFNSTTSPDGIASQWGGKWHVACLCEGAEDLGEERDLTKSSKGFYFSGQATLSLGDVSVELAGWERLAIAKRFSPVRGK